MRKPTTNGFEHFVVRAHLKGELWTLPLSGRVVNEPAAMGSRWRFRSEQSSQLAWSAQVTARGPRMPGSCRGSALVHAWDLERTESTTPSSSGEVLGFFTLDGKEDSARTLPRGAR